MTDKKRISCVTCNAPLPIGPDGEVEEPDYFACTSGGWISENEGDREAEDIDTLCRHIMTVTTAIREVFTMMDLGARKDLEHLNLGVMDVRYMHLESMRSLWHLLNDLNDETTRKVKRLDQWIWKEIDAEKKREGLRQ